MTARPSLLPLFLKLEGRKVVLVGGGPVALAKLQALLGTGAQVTVVSPTLHPDLAREDGTVVQRPFRPRDLDGAWLAIAAATPEVNREVAKAADARRIFNVAVDDPEVGTAYGAGVVRKGEVTVAISTDGRAPALAGLLREALEALLPEDLPQWVALSARLRTGWREAKVPLPERRPLLLSALLRLYPDLPSARSAP